MKAALNQPNFPKVRAAKSILKSFTMGNFRKSHMSGGGNDQALIHFGHEHDYMQVEEDSSKLSDFLIAVSFWDVSGKKPIQIKEQKFDALKAYDLRFSRDGKSLTLSYQKKLKPTIEMPKMDKNITSINGSVRNDSDLVDVHSSKSGENLIETCNFLAVLDANDLSTKTSNQVRRYELRNGADMIWDNKYLFIFDHPNMTADFFIPEQGDGSQPLANYLVCSLPLEKC